jgi:hypothetical protein
MSWRSLWPGERHNSMPPPPVILSWPKPPPRTVRLDHERLQELAGVSIDEAGICRIVWLVTRYATRQIYSPFYPGAVKPVESTMSVDQGSIEQSERRWFVGEIYDFWIRAYLGAPDYGEVPEELQRSGVYLGRGNVLKGPLARFIKELFYAAGEPLPKSDATLYEDLEYVWTGKVRRR